MADLTNCRGTVPEAITAFLKGTDVEGIDSFSIQWNRVEPSGVFHLTKPIKSIPFHPNKLDF